MKKLAVIMFLLGLIVGVHEFSHYLAMRTVGLPAEEVSIGFGPELADLGRLGDGARLKLRAVPFGGYVKSKSYGQAMTKSPASSLKAVAVALAGPFSNFLLALVTFIVGTLIFTGTKGIGRTALSLTGLTFKTGFSLTWGFAYGLVRHPIRTVMSLGGPIYIIFGKHQGIAEIGQGIKEKRKVKLSLGGQDSEQDGDGDEGQDEGIDARAAALMTFGVTTIFIGALNLLPLMPFDGGAPVLAAIYWLFGDAAAQTYVDVGAYVLCALIIAVSVGDIVKVVRERILEPRRAKREAAEKADQAEPTADAEDAAPAETTAAPTETAEQSQSASTVS